jgi:hypothetical protein
MQTLLEAAQSQLLMQTPLGVEMQRQMQTHSVAEVQPQMPIRLVPLHPQQQIRSERLTLILSVLQHLQQPTHLVPLRQSTHLDSDNGYSTLMPHRIVEGERATEASYLLQVLVPNYKNAVHSWQACPLQSFS